MNSKFFDAVKTRRTRYALSKDPVISDERIQEVVSEAVKHSPSAFNSQSARVVILLGEQHDRLWDIVKAELKKIMRPKGLALPKKKSMEPFAAVTEQFCSLKIRAWWKGCNKNFRCTKTLSQCFP